MAGRPCEQCDDIGPASGIGNPPRHDRGTPGPGGRIPPPRISTTADDGAPAPSGPRAARLSDRDRELMGHLAAGRSTAQIAAAMSVSSNTVRTRIRRISWKLAATDRRGVVRAAQLRALP